jgi:hypothetical protein
LVFGPCGRASKTPLRRFSGCARRIAAFSARRGRSRQSHESRRALLLPSRNFGIARRGRRRQLRTLVPEPVLNVIQCRSNERSVCDAPIPASSDRKKRRSVGAFALWKQDGLQTLPLDINAIAIVLGGRCASCVERGRHAENRLDRVRSGTGPPKETSCRVLRSGPDPSGYTGAQTIFPVP